MKGRIDVSYALFSFTATFRSATHTQAGAAALLQRRIV